MNHHNKNEYKANRIETDPSNRDWVERVKEAQRFDKLLSQRFLILLTLPVSPSFRVKIPVKFYCPRKVTDYKVLTGLIVRGVFIPLMGLNTPLESPFECH